MTEKEKTELQSESDIWNRLLSAAKKVQNKRDVSVFVEAGGVAAAILTEAGNIYVGVCIDTACTLGMCAERNAISSMITNGESRIKKLVAVMPDGSVGMPCGACADGHISACGCAALSACEIDLTRSMNSSAG